MENLLKSKLIGEQLSSVVFVQDYLQLHFDGQMITIFVWPYIIKGDLKYNHKDILYRNVLCEQIANTIKNISFIEEISLDIEFESNNCIKINLDPNNPEIVSEIAIFIDDMGDMYVFE